MLDKQYFFLSHTLGFAKQAHFKGIVPVGALLCDDQHHIIATSQNTVHSDVGLMHHAEMLLFLQQQQYLHEHQWESTLYCSYEPCMMCMSTAIMNHIQTIVWACDDHWAGGSHTLQHESLYLTKNKIELIGSPFPDLQKESAQLIYEYFLRTNSSKIELVLGRQLNLL